MTTIREQFKNFTTSRRRFGRYRLLKTPKAAVEDFHSARTTLGAGKPAKRRESR
jgi:hypothetical protein